MYESDAFCFGERCTLTQYYTKYIPHITFERSIKKMKYFPDILSFSQEKDEPYETEDCIRYEFKLLDVHDFANPDAPHAHESFLNSCFRCMQRYILCTKAHDPVDSHHVAKPEISKANDTADVTEKDMEKLRNRVQDMMERCSRRERNGKKNVHLQFETTEGKEWCTIGIMEPTFRSKETMRLRVGAFHCKFGKEVLDQIPVRLQLRKYEAKRRKQAYVEVASDTV